MEKPAPSFSPKLRLAAEEIKAVLNRHDIIGFFDLEDQGHAEFGTKFEASWSIIRSITDEISQASG